MNGQATSDRRARGLTWALGLLVVAALAVGCSAEASSPEEAVSEGEIRVAKPSARVVCAATFEDANGAECEGSLECHYSLECGATNQQTRCECTNGKLACHDRVGPIPVGEKQLCAPGSAADTTECPLTRGLAEGASCNVAGRLCAYRGKVCHTTPGVALMDWCRCSPAGEGVYAYNCGSALCPPEP